MDTPASTTASARKNTQKAVTSVKTKLKAVRSVEEVETGWAIVLLTGVAVAVGVAVGVDVTAHPQLVQIIASSLIS